MTNMTKTPKVGQYWLANVVGFLPSCKPMRMRVKIERVSVEADTVWVRTADVRDGGTPLVLTMSDALIERA